MILSKGRVLPSISVKSKDWFAQMETDFYILIIFWYRTEIFGARYKAQLSNFCFFISVWTNFTLFFFNCIKLPIELQPIILVVKEAVEFQY